MLFCSANVAVPEFRRWQEAFLNHLPAKAEDDQAVNLIRRKGRMGAAN